MSNLQMIQTYFDQIACGELSNEQVCDILIKLDPDCLTDIVLEYLNTIKLKMKKKANDDFGYKKYTLYNFMVKTKEKLEEKLQENDASTLLSSSSSPLNNTVILGSFLRDYKDYPVSNFRKEQINHL